MKAPTGDELLQQIAEHVLTRPVPRSKRRLREALYAARFSEELTTAKYQECMDGWMPGWRDA